MSIKIKLAEKAVDVEKALNNYLVVREPKKLYEAMAHIPLAGGKRLRPVMAQLTCEMVGGNGKKAIPFAAALEVIHNFTLVHDDVMDDDDLRRGNPTTHKKFDEATAILAGDALQPLAFELITSIETSDRNKVEMIRSLAKACGHLGMVGGQIKDIHSQNIFNMESLDLMHSEKTGRLIEASIETSGILSGLSKNDIESLKSYGAKIGLAFQIQDDIIDIESPSYVSGKDQGSDITKDKTTYPSLVGLDESRMRAKELANQAKKILLPITKNTDNLIKLADYIVSRKA